MTISSENRKTSAFTSGTALPFTFKVFETSEMLVVQQVLATGVETTLTEITHYTVALNADQNSSPGGTVNLVTTIPATDQVVLSSSILYKQLTALTNQGGFYPNVNNDVFDKLTILIQQAKELTDRSVKFPFSDPSISSDLPAVLQRAGTVLAFNETTGEPEVGPDIASVDTVAGNVADINTVAANIADVIITADDIGSIITVATNIAAVLIAAANDANITIVADDIASIIIAATNVADITNFSDVYQGPYTTAAEPTVRNDASPLQVGDLYFNTTVDEMKAYDGADWVVAYSGTVDASVLVGATLAANVLASSLTSFGTNPTANTQSQGNSSTRIATTAYAMALKHAVNENLIIKRASTTTVDIDAARLSLFDSNGSMRVIGTQGVPSSIDHTLDQDNDTAGGGSNGVLGLDTGSFTVSTWYHLYEIYNGTTKSCVSSLAQNWISTTNDGTAGATKGVDKTNISGYSWGKYIGAVYVNSGGTFDDFKQIGNRVGRGDAAVLTDGSQVTVQTLDLTAFIPSTAVNVIGYMEAKRSGSSGVATGRMRIHADSAAAYGFAQVNLDTAVSNAPKLVEAPFEMTILTPQTIYWKTDDTGSTLLGSISISIFEFEGIA